MKKTFKVYILITLLLSSVNIFTRQKNKGRDGNKQQAPARIPEKKQEKQEDVIKEMKAEELVLLWKVQHDADSKNTQIKEDPSVKKYVESHKNEIFNILFLLTIVNKLNDKNILISNAKDPKKLLDFEKQVEANIISLKSNFDKAEKNKKLEDFRKKDNYEGLEKAIKNMLVNLDLAASMEIGMINFKNNPNSLFASLYRKNTSIINDAYGTIEKKDNFIKIRDDMILYMHYNRLFSLESFLFWAIQYITPAIDKKTDAKTKNKAKIERRVFDLICSFFGIKSKVTKVTGLKAVYQKTKEYIKNNRGKVALAASPVVLYGLSALANKYGSKDGKIEKYGGKMYRGVNSGVSKGADLVYNNRASNYVKDRASKGYGYVRGTKVGSAVADAGNWVGGKAVSAKNAIGSAAGTGYEKVKNVFKKKNNHSYGAQMKDYREEAWNKPEKYSNYDEEAREEYLKDIENDDAGLYNAGNLMI